MRQIILATRLWPLMLVLAMAANGWSQAPEAPAQETPPAETPAPADPPSPEAELALRQSHVADKYARLEKLLFDLSALEAAENPQRAALLRRAYEQSSEQLTAKQLETITQLLTRREYRRAVDEQGEVVKELNALLQLLLSEDRSDRLKSEQERIREYIREVDNLRRLEADLRGRNEGGANPQKLAGEQGRVAERTDALAQKIKQNEEQNNDQQGNDANPEGDPQNADQPGDMPPGDNNDPQNNKPQDPNMPPDGQKPGDQPQPNDMPPGNNEPMPGEPMPGQPMPGQPMPGQPMPGQPMPGQPMPGQPMPGQPMPGQPMPGQPMPGGQQQSQENPARKLLEEALERMREAQQQLEEAQREASIEKQDEAIEALIKAKAELEEILRQMREEEVGRMLTLLESRFRKMLEAELRVYESTKRMDRLPEEQRGREFAIQANNLSNDQRKIAIEADKALLLLREEGSSVAFPETVEQLRDEMNLVADRLAALKVGLLTQEGQEEIILTLEELIAALQQAQQDQEQRQQQQQPSQPMEPGEQPLVDKLAELRMIRSLQMRINTRTQRYSRLLVDREDPVGEVTDDDLRDQLRNLGDREASVFEITRDLILGKNK